MWWEDDKKWWSGIIKDVEVDGNIVTENEGNSEYDIALAQFIEKANSATQNDDDDGPLSELLKCHDNVVEILQTSKPRI